MHSRRPGSSLHPHDRSSRHRPYSPPRQRKSCTDIFPRRATKHRSTSTVVVLVHPFHPGILAVPYARHRIDLPVNALLSARPVSPRIVPAFPNPRMAPFVRRRQRDGQRGKYGEGQTQKPPKIARPHRPGLSLHNVSYAGIVRERASGCPEHPQLGFRLAPHRSVAIISRNLSQNPDCLLSISRLLERSRSLEQCKW